ncbi:MAG: SPOR domain-containing protein [Gammaproteobacteria bacterium]|nr:SPOR domain-containing protein [Gammaproteobacteria bacterium]MDE0414344.1 SPOR domain-containing protein [Gammaproteobacteria bacterium]
MQSPVLERLVGGAVLVALLLLLALAIGPREGVRMPDEEGSQSPVAQVAPQPAEPANDAVPDESRREPGPRTIAQWVPPGSVPHAPQPARAFVSRGGRDALPPKSPETSERGTPSPSPREAAETPAAQAGPQWAVQLGSFSSRANADALSEWCREQGYGVKVVTGQDGGRTLHRVRVGPYASREDADTAIAELALLGRRGFVSDWGNASP